MAKERTFVEKVKLALRVCGISTRAELEYFCEGRSREKIYRAVEALCTSEERRNVNYKAKIRATYERELSGYKISVEPHVEARVEPHVEARVEPHVEASVERKTSYTISEISKLNEIELAAAYKSVTGKTTLPCKHCHEGEAEIERFIGVIRVACKKSNGLNAEVKVAKTCDHQTENNEKRNAYYRALKKAQNEEEVAKIKSAYRTAFPNERRVYKRRV